MSRLGPVLFTVLLACAVVLAGVVVQARSPDLELEVTRMPKKFSPNGNGHHDVAVISFYVRDSDPDATVQIVGPDRERVRTLYRGPLDADEPVTFRWNGRAANGRLASPAHRYRLRVVLPDQDRDMVYPRQMAIVGTGG